MHISPQRTQSPEFLLCESRIQKLYIMSDMLEMVQVELKPTVVPVCRQWSSWCLQSLYTHLKTGHINTWFVHYFFLPSLFSFALEVLYIKKNYSYTNNSESCPKKLTIFHYLDSCCSPFKFCCCIANICHISACSVDCTGTTRPL